MSGIYVLLHPVNTGEYTVVKIGYSTDINRRMKDSCYNTMFWGDYRPKLIFKALINTTVEDLKYIEDSIHRALSQYRIDPRKELFYNITVDAMKNVFDHYQIQCTVDEGVETIICDTKPVEDSKFDVIQRPVLDELNNLVDTNTVSPMRHQVEIINTLLNTYYPVSGYKGKLVLPCGYGKLWISLFTMRMMDNGYNCLYVVMGPSTILVEQFLEASVRVMPDWNVMVYDGTRKDVTIGADRPTLMITTYHSADQLSNIMGERVPRLVVYDEAHRTCTIGDEPGQFRNTLSLFPQSNKLFMTATERIVIHDSTESSSSGSESSSSSSSGSEDEDSDSDGEEGEEDEDCAGVIRGVLSMDDELVYGPTIMCKTFENAIADDIICDYRVAVPTENSESVDVVHHALYNLSIHHLLVYNNTLAESFDLCNALTARGIRAYYIDGTMSSSKRNEILRQFGSDSVAVLCSCKTLTEGVSVPIVDSVYFADPRSSEIDITQCIGRALRLHPFKTLATIITPSSMLKSRGFLSTMITMDVRNKMPGVLRKKMMSVPNGMVLSSAANKGTKTLLDQMSRYVGFVIMGKNDGLWEYKLGVVLDYERSSGSMVTGKVVHNGQWIGKWMCHQKTNLKSGILNNDRYQLLLTSATWSTWISSGKHLKVKKEKRTWDQKLELAAEYEKNTSGNITQHTVYNNTGIGQWMCGQKKALKFGKLTNEKYQRLMSLTSWMSWISSGKHLTDRKTWNQNLELVLEYEAINDKCVTNREVHQRGTNIGNWFNNQKRDYRIGKLSNDRCQLLMSSLTWQEWFASGNHLAEKMDRKTWDQTFEVLMDYEGCTGESVISTTVHQGINVGQWVTGQKSACKAGKLNNERYQRLMSSSSFSTWIASGKHLVKQKTWDQYLELMMKLERDTGGNVTQNTVCAEAHVGKWVAGQKTNYKKNKLSTEKLQQLRTTRTWSAWEPNNYNQNYPPI